MDRTDTDFMIGIQQRDEQCLRGLMGRHKDMILGIFMEWGFDKMTAEDLANEFWMKVWENAGQCQPPDFVMKWCRSIAYNMRHDQYEAEQSDPTESLPDEPFEDEDEGAPATPLSLTTDDRPAIDLSLSLDQLAPESRALVEESYRWGVQQGELVQQYRLSESSIRRRLRIAKEKARDYLEFVRTWNRVQNDPSLWVEPSPLAEARMEAFIQGLKDGKAARSKVIPHPARTLHGLQPAPSKRPRRRILKYALVACVPWILFSTALQEAGWPYGPTPDWAFVGPSPEESVRPVVDPPIQAPPKRPLSAPQQVVVAVGEWFSQDLPDHPILSDLDLSVLPRPIPLARRAGLGLPSMDVSWTLLYTSAVNREDSDIYGVDREGHRQNLTDHAGDDTFPAWSPTGFYIAFTSYRDGRGEIYRMNADGSNPVNLTRHPAWDEYPAWSPDGIHMAFHRGVGRAREGDSDIYTIRFNGSGLRRLTLQPGFDGEPSWSPDGRWIAFRTDRDGQAEIYRMRPDGSEQTRLTYDEAFDGEPSWSPDSQRLAFRSNRDGNMEIYTMHADGTNVQNLTQAWTNERDPAWSPDGQQIALQSDRNSGLFKKLWRRLYRVFTGRNFVDGNMEVYVLNLKTSQYTRITDTKQFDGEPTWRPGL